ncbi:MAG: tRNA (cytidine(34)-2'-O)-methyltransferase [Opitutales bacterium]|nr:tRNA (cytidine(34)-2'-O)-methyltransferase [Opitutales bacterium]
MFHVVLFQPEIPQNTGNIGRLCSITECRLHLIHPLGFRISDKHLRRSGMDYWYELDLCEHENWESFCQSPKAPKRLWMFTTKATKPHWDVSFAPGDGFLFGQETSGCPEWLHREIGDEHRLTIPQPNPKARSLNVANSVAIAVYEALRQKNFPG